MMSHLQQFFFINVILKDYLEIINDPIDFGTIRTKLLNNSYTNLKDFDTHCKYVF